MLTFSEYAKDLVTNNCTVCLVNLDNMKVTEMILILGWISLFSTMVFLFNNHTVYKCDVQPIKMPPAEDSLSLNDNGIQNDSRL